MRTVQVPLGTRTYTIVVDRKLLSTLGECCGNFGLAGRCAVITDRNVAEHFARNAMYSLKKVGIDAVLIMIPAGERSKSLKVPPLMHMMKLLLWSRFRTCPFPQFAGGCRHS